MLEIDLEGGLSQDSYKSKKKSIFNLLKHFNMEVLGSLAKLKSEDSLPLPWWHRAPIGLLNKTFVFVALVESENRPVGDLILTVLEPEQWKNMLRIECYGDDKPGFISKVFDSILPLNISIAETVTLETGAMHHVTLICEPFGNETLTSDQIQKKLEANGITDFKVRPFFKLPPKRLWHRYVPVEHGWVNNVEWKKAIEKIYPSDKIDLVDLNRVVVSADTSKRLLRYVFPKKGAILIKVEHADIPGAMKEITNVFGKCHSNILSLLLRRGGATPRNATLVAVCEPMNKSSFTEFSEQIKNGLLELDQNIRAEWEIRDGENLIIYPNHTDALLARFPI